ncbi:Inactive elicitor Avr1b [Phytophthora megakarya]|uniref:RxLR effector protein n=1 Tax=Phytophthora megakarya TaxID=4795 RepID=A0A225WGY0_9STRA|nr:Inactive elicitor Avr1b [Phytophthora megakarya]
MRLSFLLLTVLAGTIVMDSNATPYSTKTKTSVMGSPAIAHSLSVGQNDGVTGKRFLRAHHDHGESNMEERAGDYHFSGLVEKAAAKLANKLLNRPNKANIAYGQWEAAGMKLTDVDDFLKLADPQNTGKYDEVYNGYMHYKDLV